MTKRKPTIAAFTVRSGLWDNETKVATVGENRHTVIFPNCDGKESTLTFCNNCGESFATTMGKCMGCGSPIAFKKKT